MYLINWKITTTTTERNNNDNLQQNAIKAIMKLIQLIYVGLYSRQWALLGKKINKKKNNKFILSVNKA